MVLVVSFEPHVLYLLSMVLVVSFEPHVLYLLSMVLVVSFEPHVLFQQSLQDIWTESLSVNSVNLVNITATIPEISNFS